MTRLIQTILLLGVFAFVQNSSVLGANVLSENGKPKLIVLNVTNCEKCDEIVASILEEPRYVSLFQSNLNVFTQVGEMAYTFAQQYNIKAFPAFVLLDAQDNFITSYQGETINTDSLLMDIAKQTNTVSLYISPLVLPNTDGRSESMGMLSRGKMVADTKATVLYDEVEDFEDYKISSYDLPGYGIILGSFVSAQGLQETLNRCLFFHDESNSIYVYRQINNGKETYFISLGGFKSVSDAQDMQNAIYEAFALDTKIIDLDIIAQNIRE